jgi:hypothetical protein
MTGLQADMQIDSHLCTCVVETITIITEFGKSQIKSYLQIPINYFFDSINHLNCKSKKIKSNFFSNLKSNQITFSQISNQIKSSKKLQKTLSEQTPRYSFYTE